MWVWICVHILFFPTLELEAYDCYLKKNPGSSDLNLIFGLAQCVNSVT